MLEMTPEGEGDCTDDSAFDEDLRWTKERRAQVEGKGQSRKLHQSLQNVATALKASNDQISDLQLHLRRTRRKWTYEDESQRQEVLQLQQVSSKLISSCLPQFPTSKSSEHEQQHHGSHSIRRTHEPSTDLSQNDPKKASNSSSAQINPGMLHQRLRMMIETSAEALQHTPRGTNVQTPFQASTPHTQLTSSGLYLMIDAATGRPLGRTVLHPDRLATVHRNMQPQSPAQSGCSPQPVPASPGRSSCHTQTIDSTDAGTCPDLHPGELQYHMPGGEGSHAPSVANTSPDDNRFNLSPGSMPETSPLTPGFSSFQASTSDDDNASRNEHENIADESSAPALEQEATCYIGKKDIADHDPCSALSAGEYDSTNISSWTTPVQGQGQKPSVTGEQPSYLERAGDQAAPPSGAADVCKVSMNGAMEPSEPVPEAPPLSQEATVSLIVPPPDPSISLFPAQQLPMSRDPSFGSYDPGASGSWVQPELGFDEPADCGRNTAAADVSTSLDAGDEDPGTSVLQRSMRDSLSQLSAGRRPGGSTSGRHSSQSRRSSIVPADDILPYRTAAPLHTDGSRYSSTSAVLGLLKEESDCFEEDAPLNFLQPTVTGSPQLKNATVTPAAPTDTAGLGGFHLTRPSMDTSVGSQDMGPSFGASRVQRNQPKSQKPQRQPQENLPDEDSLLGGLGLEDFDF